MLIKATASGCRSPPSPPQPMMGEIPWVRKAALLENYKVIAAVKGHDSGLRDFKSEESLKKEIKGRACNHQMHPPYLTCYLSKASPDSVLQDTCLPPFGFN